eukprot:11194901-Alexandrium_andersonii.AAC.1
MREKWRRTHPSGALVIDAEAVSGSTQFQVRTSEASLACPLYAVAARFDRFDRFDSLLGSI